MHASVPTRGRRAPERHDAAPADGGHLRGTPQRGHVSPALVCLDFYVLTAGKARVWPGWLLPRLGGLGDRVAGLRFGTSEGPGWGGGSVRSGGRGVSEPLVLGGARTPRAQLFLHRSEYFERLTPPSLGSRS